LAARAVLSRARARARRAYGGPAVHAHAARHGRGGARHRRRRRSPGRAWPDDRRGPAPGAPAPPAVARRPARAHAPWSPPARRRRGSVALYSTPMKLWSPFSGGQAKIGRLAPRKPSLAGLTIGVLDNSKPNAGALLHRVAELLAARTGAAGVRGWSKPSAARP